MFLRRRVLKRKPQEIKKLVSLHFNADITNSVAAQTGISFTQVGQYTYVPGVFGYAKYFYQNTYIYSSRAWFNDFLKQDTYSIEVRARYEGSQWILIIGLDDSTVHSIVFRLDFSSSTSATIEYGYTAANASLISYHHTAIPAGFNHYTVSKKGSTYYLFLNGTLLIQKQLVDFSTIAIGVGAVTIGGRNTLSVYNGTLDELVIHTGYAYTNNFTPSMVQSVP